MSKLCIVALAIVALTAVASAQSNKSQVCDLSNTYQLILMSASCKLSSTFQWAMPARPSASSSGLAVPPTFSAAIR